MKYAKTLFILGYSLNIAASEIPWVESRSASSAITWVEVVSQYSNISFVRRSTLSSLLSSLSVERSNSSTTPIVAAMLAQVDPLDKSLNIGEWISTCSLDELDK